MKKIFLAPALALTLLLSASVLAGDIPTPPMVCAPGQQCPEPPPVGQNVSTPPVEPEEEPTVTDNVLTFLYVWYITSPSL